MANKQKKRSIFAKFRNFFIAGVVVLIPIGVTLYLPWYNSVDMGPGVAAEGWTSGTAADKCEFKSGASSKVGCVDYSNEKEKDGFSDHMQISIYSKVFGDFLSYEAY